MGHQCPALAIILPQEKVFSIKYSNFEAHHKKTCLDSNCSVQLLVSLDFSNKE